MRKEFSRENVDELFRLSLGTVEERVELARVLEEAFLTQFGKWLLRSVLAPWHQDSDISVQEIELCVNPTVRERELRNGRFNVLDRAMQLARLEMADREAIELIDAMGECSEISCTHSELLDLLSEKMNSYETILRSRELDVNAITINSFSARWLSKDTVYLFGPPETVGYLNLVQDIEMIAAYEPHPDPDEAKAGWFVSQIVQIAILPNPDVLKITLLS